MRFSIIVLGYNQTKTIIPALDSAVNQTYPDVEVIFVDDASTDGTVALVQSHYTSKQVRIVEHPVNMGMFAGRMDGLRSATGDYVLFLDGDDALELNACEILEKTIRAQTEAVDIVGFGTKIEYTSSVDEYTRNDLESLMTTPCLGQLTGVELCERIFLDKEMAHVVWNKCYRIEVLRRFAAQAVTTRLCYNEDFYTTFVVSLMAQRYVGIPDQLYVYEFGQGISAVTKIPLKKYFDVMNGYFANKACREYAEANGYFSKFQDALDRNKLDLMYTSFFRLRFLSREDRDTAAVKLFETFGADYAISILANYFQHEKYDIGKYLNIGKVLPVTRKEIKTVAMFYHRLRNGGVERVISLLCDILTKQNYRLVVITEDDPTENDYPLPEGVPHVAIGSPQEGSYTDRHNKWCEIIRKYEIDAVVYHSWLYDSIMWDMLSIKRTGAAFITHSHNIFICGLNQAWHGIRLIRDTLQHSDMMLTLTDADRVFWSRFCPRVQTVQNPMTFHFDKVPSAPLDNHNILWLARFDYDQKCPEDPLDIMHHVVQKVPDAVLYMVGDLTDELRKHFEDKIEQMGLTGHIILPGYSSNVQAYYQNAAVHLMTTNYEGYGMTLTESLVNGVPVVTYELPYLTRVRKSNAVIQTPWRDITATADALVDLLSDLERRRQMGAIGRAEVLAQQEYDYAAVWNKILTNVVGDPDTEAAIDRETFQEFAAAYDLAAYQMCSTIWGHSSQMDRKNWEIEELVRARDFFEAQANTARQEVQKVWADRCDLDAKLQETHKELGRVWEERCHFDKLWQEKTLEVEDVWQARCFFKEQFEQKCREYDEKCAEHEREYQQMQASFDAQIAAEKSKSDEIWQARCQYEELYRGAAEKPLRFFLRMCAAKLRKLFRK